MAQEPAPATTSLLKVRKKLAFFAEDVIRGR